MTNSTTSDATALGIAGTIGALSLGAMTLALGIWGIVAVIVGYERVDLLASGTHPDAPFATITTVEVASEALPDGARALVIAGAVVGLVVTTAAFIAVALFCLAVARQTPFRVSVVRLIEVVGFTILLGGILSQGLSGLGRMVAGGELGAPFEAAFTFDPFAPLLGFVLLVASYVVRAGLRLQRDTEGLV